MKNNFYISILTGITLLVGFYSCEGFLDKNPQGQLTQTAFPISENDALLATNAVYSSVRNWFYNSGGYPILDIMSDDALKGSNVNDQSATVGAYDNFSITATQDGLDRWWATLYEGIKRANVVIEKVGTINMDVNLRNRYIAEARFLRGLFYFDLVRAWGGVPIVTSTNPPLKITRSTAEEVYKQAETDFLAALEFLPEKSAQSRTDYGRATKGAARAFLSKLYLFKKDFTNAEKYALEVINSNEYDLETLFIDANNVKGEHGIESIFEIGASTDEGAGAQFANTQGVRGTPNRGWGFNRPSLDLRNSFETNDPRLDGTIIDLGEILDGVEILGDGTTPDKTYDQSGKLIEIECYSQKIWTPGNNTTTQENYNRRLMRYADILLIAAEALNENNKSSTALIHLNKIRKRARQGNNAILPDISATGKDALRLIIIEERRHELAMEGQRFWDLVRTGLAANVLGPLGFISGKHELMPIPQNEIDISQGALTQNNY